SAKAFPPSVIDLTQAVARDELEAMRLRDKGGGFDGPLHRAAVRGGNRVARQSRRQPLGLHPAIRSERHIGRSRKPILDAERRLPVSHQKHSCHAQENSAVSATPRRTASSRPPLPRAEPWEQRGLDD